MASETDPIAPRTWVAIDIAKGVNVVLVEHPDGRQERFRFVHRRADYDRLVSFLKTCPGPCRIALEPTADYHRTIAHRLVSEGFDLVWCHLSREHACAKRFSTLGTRMTRRTRKSSCGC
jgi:transposase